MKIYCYDYFGFFIEESEAELCQVTELNKLSNPGIDSVYIMPAYSTLFEPCICPDGYKLKFDGSAWVTEEIIIPKEEEKPEVVISYLEKRRAEYPHIYEYIDGIVKKDQNQVDKYIADCLAVKAKYPRS